MQPNPYRDLFKAMNDAGIRYLIVGGVAVNLHGYRRFTGDVDILLMLNPENLEKMTTLMHFMHYIERLPVQLQELSDHGKVERFLAEKGMTAYTFLAGAEERIDVDVLAAASLQFDDYDQRKVMLDIDEDIKVPVVSFDDLIAFKKGADRPKDREDLAALLSLKGL